MKDRFLKGLLHDLPSPGGLTPSEQILKVNHQLLHLLKQRLPSSISNVSGTGLHLDVSIPNIAAELRPQFHGMIESQQRLASHVSGQGYLGQMMLSEQKAQNNHLDELSAHAKDAYHQRNTALKLMSQGIVELSNMNGELENINEGLDEIHGELQEVNNGLGNIAEELVRTNAELIGIRGTIEHFSQAICGILGDIGMGIKDVGLEIASTRFAIVQQLHQATDIFSWSHREASWQRNQLIFSLNNPRRVKSNEEWEMGESLRRHGDIVGAAKMLLESIETNPLEARSYFSLGMITLHSGDYIESGHYFRACYEFATQNPKLQAYALMYLAKILIFEGNFNYAKIILGRAADLDSSNLDICYELAVCCAHLDQKDACLLYIKTILQQDRRYIYKMLSESIFQKYIQEIRDLMNA